MIANAATVSTELLALLPELVVYFTRSTLYFFAAASRPSLRMVRIPRVLTRSLISRLPSSHQKRFVWRFTSWTLWFTLWEKVTLRALRFATMPVSWQIFPPVLPPFAGARDGTSGRATRAPGSPTVASLRDRSAIFRLIAFTFEDGKFAPRDVFFLISNLMSSLRSESTVSSPASGAASSSPPTARRAIVAATATSSASMPSTAAIATRASLLLRAETLYLESLRLKASYLPSPLAIDSFGR